MKDMSKILSGRAIQPGSMKYGLPAHQRFDSAVSLLKDTQIIAEPRFFQKQGWVAMIPDYCLVRDGRAIFFELKRQGPQGNAHERLYKNFTTKKMNLVIENYGLSEYPLYGILCDSLATEHRYIREFAQNLERENYFLWKDYDEVALSVFINKIFNRGAGICLTSVA